MPVKLQNQGPVLQQRGSFGVDVVVAVLQPLKHGGPIPIDRAVVLIGRASECDAVITDSRKISRRHCCLVHSDNAFLIRDLGSMNGVWINGHRVDREAEMTQGDQVSIGDLEFRFVVNAREEDVPSALEPDPQGTPEIRIAPVQNEDVVDVIPVHEVIDPDDAVPAVDCGEIPDAVVVDEVDVLGGVEAESGSAAADETDTPPSQRARSGQSSESDPVIDLDDRFADDDIEDVIILDDD